MPGRSPEATPERVVLATYPSRHEAELVRGLLASEGVETALLADDCGTMSPMLQFTLGVRLLVDPADLERARLLLEDFEAPVPEELEDGDESGASSPEEVGNRDPSGRSSPDEPGPGEERRTSVRGESRREDDRS